MMGDVASSVGEHGREKLQTCDELNLARMKTQKEQDQIRRRDEREPSHRRAEKWNALVKHYHSGKNNYIT